MSEKYVVARPYARAIFEVAQANDGPNWSALLKGLTMIVTNAQVIALANHPKYGPLAVAKLINAVLGECPTEVQTLIELLAKNNRLLFLPEIFELYQQFKARAEQMVYIQVVSAQPLEAAFQTRLTKALSQRFNAEITLSCDCDPTLLGGAVIQAGDQVIDGSVRKKLAQLSEALSI
jgi:F-type H+-transporting ATPase subunit delta